MDFYLDEDVSAASAHRLIVLGNDAMDARGAVAHATKDHQHLALATRLGRILVTYNVDDFVLLHLAWREWFEEFGKPPLADHGGIIIVPQPPDLTALEAADLIHDFVDHQTMVGLRNRLFRWTALNGWQEIVPTPPLPPRSGTRRRF